MRISPTLAALAACGLMGCDSGPPPLPRVLSVEPNTMSSSGTVPVTITVEAVLPIVVDYGQGGVTVDRSLIASVGTVVVSNRYEPDGLLTGRVPSRLQPGRHDVTVTLFDGRLGVLPGAFTVTAGSWPSAGFAIAPISSPQRVNVPFTLTITAQGANAGTFNGTVDYVIQNVSLTPVTTGPFTNGVYQESLVIGAPTMGTTHVTVYDLQNGVATSNDFVVSP